jgi:DNA repair exonuclease SbcCD nuclease subunit
VAENQGVDFVVACGDLFEHNQVADDQVTAVARILRAHPSVEIHAIPGNHDLPGPGSVWNRAALRGVPSLHIYTVPAPTEIALSDGGVVVLHPLPVKSRYSLEDPLARLESVANDPRVHIGLAHGHITTITFGAHEGDIKLPIDPSHVDRIGLDYLALGHWHGTRLITTGSDGTRIAYSGTHEQTAYREGDSGNLLLVSIEAKGAPPEIRRVRVGHLRWEQRVLTFAGDGNIDRLRQILANHDADFVELTLDGELPNLLYAEYHDLLSQNGGFKHLRVNDSALSWVADAEEALPPLSDASLAEIQRRLWKRLATAVDLEAQIAREAVGLFGRYVREATE